MITDKNQQFKNLFNHPSWDEHNLQVFFLLDKQDVYTYIIDADYNIQDYIKNELFLTAVGPKSLIAKFNKILIEKYNFQDYNFNNLNYNMNMVYRNNSSEFAIRDRVNKICFNFFLESVKNQYCKLLNEPNNIDIQQSISLFYFSYSSVLSDSLISILDSIEKSTCSIQDKYRELLSFDFLVSKMEQLSTITNYSNTFCEHFNQSIKLHHTKQNLLFLKYESELLSSNDPIIISQNITLQSIKDRIDNIFEDNPKFSFKKQTSENNNIVANLEKTDFFTKFPNYINKFYSPVESADIFNDIFEDKVSYNYHATFGINKKKVLSLCEDNQSKTYMGYLCNDFFQNLLNVANSMCNYDLVYIMHNELDKNNSDDYQAYIYNNSPIDLNNFKKFLQQALLAYKQTNENNFNQQTVQAIFEETIFSQDTLQYSNHIKPTIKKF